VVPPTIQRGGHQAGDGGDEETLLEMEMRREKARDEWEEELVK
jgi:hypothetical protein